MNSHFSRATGNLFRTAQKQLSQGMLKVAQLWLFIRRDNGEQDSSLLVDPVDLIGPQLKPSGCQLPQHMQSNHIHMTRLKHHVLYLNYSQGQNFMTRVKNLFCSR